MPRRLFIIALLTTVVTACGLRFGEGDGNVSGRICSKVEDNTDCDDDFDMHASFFAIERFGDRAVMEIRSSAGQEHETDNLLFLITSPEEIASKIGEAIPLDPKGIVRPQIHLIDELGFTHYPLVVDPDPERSTINFLEFGTDSGDRVHAVFHFDIIGSADRKPRGHLDGWTRFEVTKPFPGNNMELDPW